MGAVIAPRFSAGHVWQSRMKKSGPLKTENFTPILDAVAATGCDPVVLLLSVGHDPDGHVHTQRIALPRKGLEVVPVVTFPLPAV